MRPTWILLLVAATTASGCLTAAPTASEGADPGPVPPDVATSQDETAPAPGAPREIRWESCRGLVGTFEAPAELARGLVPPEFRHGGLTAETRSFLFEAVQCERFATDARVLPDAGYFHLLARVAPRDASWAEPGVASHYSVLLLGAGADVASALALVGAPAEAADLAQSSHEAPAAADLHSWSYAAAGHNLQLEYATSDQPAADRDHRVHHWYAAPDGFRRVDATKDYGVDGLASEAGVLRAAGDDGLVQLQESTPWVGQAYAHLDEAWSAHDTLFPTKEA